MNPNVANVTTMMTTANAMQLAVLAMGHIVESEAASESVDGTVLVGAALTDLVAATLRAKIIQNVKGA